MNTKLATPHQVTIFGAEAAQPRTWAANSRRAANSPLRPVWPSDSLEDSWHAAQDLWLRVAKFTTVHRSGRGEVSLIFTLHPRIWTEAERAEWALLHSRLIDIHSYTAWHEGRRVQWVKSIDELSSRCWRVSYRQVEP
jgi:hypothetical protein